MYASVVPHFTRELLSPGLRVGYADEGGVWQFVAPSLSQRLPLRAIEWRNLVGVTKRIDQLHVHFVDLATALPATELPLACIYVVKCEDFDRYKSTVRPQLVAWVEAMTAAKVEWLILYVPLGTRPKAAGNVPHAVYKRVYERLRSDFAHPKSSPMVRGPSGPAHSSGLDRVCKIDTLEGTSVLGQQQQHEAQWTDLLVRLRHCVMDAFETKCFQYEEHLRVLDAQRGTAGWDRGAFFKAKETVALMYQQMYLQDDAIRHLDELEAIFGTLDESEKPHLPSSGNHHSFTRHDAIFTLSPLALDLPATQHLIATNRASRQLVALYCFCRQLRTFYVMGTFSQLLERATSFIESFVLKLSTMTHLVEWYHPFLWAIGACLEIAYACELSWSGRDDEWTASSVSVQTAQAIPVEEMSRGLGNVLYLARRLLCKFASQCQVDPFVATPRTEPTTWYQQLAHVLQERGTEASAHCLAELTHLASMHFSQSGRHRFAVFLGQECATYHLLHNELETASSLLRSVARQSEEDGWYTIYGPCMRQLCQTELALGRRTEAVAACYNLLEVAQDEDVHVSDDEMQALIEQLVTSCNEGTLNPECGTLTPLFRPTLAIETVQSQETPGTHGDLRVTLELANAFPAAVQLETVRIRFEKSHEKAASLLLEDAPQREERNSVPLLDNEHQPEHHASSVVLEETCVHFDANTGVKLVFLHSKVPIGHYSCTQVDCVLGKRLFRLLPSSDLRQATFCIQAKEQIGHVTIEGPRVLIPSNFTPVETVVVTMQANEETIANGTLEMRVLQAPSHLNHVGSKDDEDEDATSRQACTVRLIQAARRETAEKVLVPSDCKEEEGGRVLSVALPTIPRQGHVAYLVSLATDPVFCTMLANAHDRSDSHVTLRASVRYDREAKDGYAPALSTTVRQVDSTFRIVLPLTHVVRCQRVGSRLFTSIALTCHAGVALTLCDYEVLLSASVHVETDPNDQVRGITLRPRECVHLAFTLVCGPEFDEVGTRDHCTLRVLFTYNNEPLWEKAMTFPLFVATVSGPQYQLEVVPVKAKEEMEATVNEPLTFTLRVQETAHVAPSKDSHLFAVCLDEQSEGDWILVGKPMECFQFDSIMRSNGAYQRAFCTQKRVLATRCGRVRFPAFRLQVNGHTIHSTRVYCQQSSRRILITL